MQIPPAILPPNYRRKPILTYCGLTIILSNPGRFDRADVLSSTSGNFFCTQCLGPEYNRMQCDIRLVGNTEPFQENTKVVLLLGDKAAQQYLGDKNTLNEIRGSCYTKDGIVFIASYHPQDAWDILKEHEDKLNPYLQLKAGASSNAEDDRDDEDRDEADEKRRHGRTKRKNFLFWLQQDVAKVKRILVQGRIPSPPFNAEYILYPSSDTICQILQQTKNQKLFIDIETDINWNILCFSFSFNYGPVYIVPCLDHNYKWAYTHLPQIYKSLAIAFRDNCVVAHNGAGFDFFVFALKYKIMVGNSVGDTMLMQHRCFLEVEKSLGHCTSLWTYEPFHKDEANFAYNNAEVARQLWMYNGKDVYTMMLIYKSIMDYAKTQPGLLDSIEQAHKSIRPYLITSLKGIAYRDDQLKATMAENDRWMMEYLRWCDLLIGKDNIKALRRKSKSGLCASNTQCTTYFHTMLGYPVIAYGKSSKKDGVRKPSLQKKNMLKLRLKHDNPVISICMLYREVAKETGSLKFNPWISREELKNYAPTTS